MTDLARAAGAFDGFSAGGRGRQTAKCPCQGFRLRKPRAAIEGGVIQAASWGWPVPAMWALARTVPHRTTPRRGPSPALRRSAQRRVGSAPVVLSRGRI